MVLMFALHLYQGVFFQVFIYVKVRVSCMFRSKGCDSSIDKTFQWPRGVSFLDIVYWANTNKRRGSYLEKSFTLQLFVHFGSFSFFKNLDKRTYYCTLYHKKPFNINPDNTNTFVLSGISKHILVSY